MEFNAPSPSATDAGTISTNAPINIGARDRHIHHHQINHQHHHQQQQQQHPSSSSVHHSHNHLYSHRDVDRDSDGDMEVFGSSSVDIDHDHRSLYRVLLSFFSFDGYDGRRRQRILLYISLIFNVLLLLAVMNSDDGQCNGGMNQNRPRLGYVPLQSSSELYLEMNHITSGGSLTTKYKADKMPIEIDNDLSNTSFDLNEHLITWHYCPLHRTSESIADPSLSATVALLPSGLQYCDETPIVEQWWQLQWYGVHVNVQKSKSDNNLRTMPTIFNCVHLPPKGYLFPPKSPALPSHGDAVNWPNFRVSKHEDLIVFNKGTPKNLYHFDSPQYDQDGIDEMKLGAKYIPFGTKVRLMLDIGAGGGSLGLLLQRRYDVKVLATIFPDWPYCEYISERGGLCILVDVMEAIRPGGYLWMRGGWSHLQISTLQNLLVHILGYKIIYSHISEKPKMITETISFGDNLPYQSDWWVIAVKPVAAHKADQCS